VELSQLYKKYGAPDFNQNYNIYKRIAVDLFATSTTEDKNGKCYQLWAGLRDMLLDLVTWGQFPKYFMRVTYSRSTKAVLAIICTLSVHCNLLSSVVIYIAPTSFCPC
jgi:hypothetical protein